MDLWRTGSGLGPSSESVEDLAMDLAIALGMPTDLEGHPPLSLAAGTCASMRDPELGLAVLNEWLAETKPKKATAKGKPTQVSSTYPRHATELSWYRRRKKEADNHVRLPLEDSIQMLEGSVELGHRVGIAF